MSFLTQQSLPEIFQNNLNRYQPLAQFIQNTMQGESAFTPGERELIAAYVSSLNACKYCYDAHQAIAVDLNVDPDLLAAILQDIDTAPIRVRLRSVFSLVKKIILTPSKTTQADLDAVIAAGWEERAVEDAIAVCSLFNLMNRFVDGFGLKPPSQLELSGMSKMINSQGYQALVQSVEREKSTTGQK